MRITSGHYQTDHFPKWEQAVNDAKSVGIEYMVISSLHEQEQNSIENLKKVCASMNKQAEVCKQYGLKLGYHNHSGEFAKVDGQVIYEIMLKELDPKLVAMELDIYWAVFAYQDPLKLIAANPGRFQLWHVKDMDKTDRKKNADVGTGSIDFKAIFAKAAEAGLKHFYVEQETYQVSPVDSVKACAENLKKSILT
jgi:sugar phosphate isomerase/epimerase